MSQHEVIPLDALLRAKESTPKITNNNDQMKKIIMMVGFAIVIFLAFIGYSLKTSLTNNERLLTIKDIYFPVLEKVDANIVRLDKMEESFLQAVMTAEASEIDSAQTYFDEATAAFDLLLSIYPDRVDEINELKASFSSYFDVAKKTTESFMNNSEDADQLADDMTAAMNALRDKIKSFREESYGNFANTLVESQKAATLSLYMSMAVGVMNLVFMGVLVFFIRNNIKMVAVIADQNATLEHRVAERTEELHKKTNDINAMLHNMTLGVCTVVKGNKLHNEYSSYLETIFNSNQLADKDVMESLFASSNLGADSKDQINVALDSIIGEEQMIFEFNSHLLAKEMTITAGDHDDKILQLSWNPIVNEHDIVEKVLLIAQDVTALKALELASAKQKEELDIISQLIKVPVGKFNDFIDSANGYVSENKKLIEAATGNSAELIAALFRNMHTIKGNARTYEFLFITNVAHEAEQEYDRLRKDLAADWNKDLLLQQIYAVAEGIDRYQEVNDNKMGRKGRSSDQLTSRGVFVGKEDLVKLKAMAAANVEGKSNASELEDMIAKIGMTPLERLVTGAMDTVATLAEQLNKPTPVHHIKGSNLYFSSEFAQALKSSLMHVVRNSMDHGIEAADQRVQAGKSAEGNLTFACIDNGQQMELHISDDGRGLALHKLHEKGVKDGVFKAGQKPAVQEVADLIFHSGMSTAEKVSDISGRGVGMDAVRTFMREQQADIRLEMAAVSGDNFGFTPFRFVITLPATAYRI
jgi:HPt (histidine-containing phosphotransfer) domain-containing protein